MMENVADLWVAGRPTALQVDLKTIKIVLETKHEFLQLNRISF